MSVLSEVVDITLDSASKLSAPLNCRRKRLPNVLGLRPRACSPFDLSVDSEGLPVGLLDSLPKPRPALGLALVTASFHLLAAESGCCGFITADAHRLRSPPL